MCLRPTLRSLTLAALALPAGPALAQPLVGRYAVPGAFPTLAAAVEALNTRGVAGPVFLDLAQTTFEERVTLTLGTGGVNGQNGTGPDRRVTISRAGNRPFVELRPPAATGPDGNFTLLLDGADYVTVSALTFTPQGVALGRALVVRGTPSNPAEGVTVEGNTFNGSNQPGGTAADRALVTAEGPTVALTIRGNTLQRGAGLRLVALADAPATGTVVRSNQVRNARYGEETGAVVILGHPAVAVEANTVAAAGLYGIAVERSPGARIEGNAVDAIEDAAVGLRLRTSGGANARVVNNAVAVSEAGAWGMALDESPGVRVLHNTVRVMTGAGPALRLASAGAVVRNNLVVHEGTGLVLDVADPADAPALDYNDLVAAGPLFGRWGGTVAPTLDAWRATTGQDAHSFAVPVAFAAALNLHLAGASQTDARLAGSVLPDVPTDLDGDPRPAPGRTAPFVGADEGAAGTSSSLDGPAGRLALAVGPSPAVRAATVTATLPAAGAARVEVFDGLGRRVAVLHDGPLASGPHAFVLVRPLAAGTYVVRLTAAGAVATRPLTVVR